MAADVSDPGLVTTNRLEAFSDGVFATVACGLGKRAATSEAGQGVYVAAGTSAP